MGLLPLHAVEDLQPYVTDWNHMALRAGTPFLTTAWLSAWWDAYGSGQRSWLVLTDADGRLRAGACCRRSGSALGGTANDHTGDWDVVAADLAARADLWRQLGDLEVPRLTLPELRDHDESAGVASGVLQEQGYRVVRQPGPLSPFLDLPAAWDDLLSSVSRNLRSQLQRRRRALGRRGDVVFRTCTTESMLEDDLAKVFRVEAAGWKSRSGTAILSDPRTQALYRAFARQAVQEGWLRLHILELGGEPVAADYGCAFAGGGFLLKTGYDERYADLSPGLILRGEVLRSSIEEGLRFYEFLGGPDPYKVRWTHDIRPRVTLRAFRGASTWPDRIYWSRLRPRLKRSRDRLVRVLSERA